MDSELLADVYLELIGGRQPDLILKQTINSQNKSEQSYSFQKSSKRNKTLSPRLTQEEKKVHDDFVDTLGDDSVWKTAYK